MAKKITPIAASSKQLIAIEGPPVYMIALLDQLQFALAGIPVFGLLTFHLTTNHPTSECGGNQEGCKTDRLDQRVNLMHFPNSGDAQSRPGSTLENL